MDDILKKIDELMNEGKEEFENAFFPSLDSTIDFELLVKEIQKKLDDFNQYESCKRDIGIVKQLFKKLKEERGFDIVYNRLHNERFYLTKKIDQGNISFEGLSEKWDTGETIPVEKLCNAYAYSFERFCKLYLRPIASIIQKQEVRKCGKALEFIQEFFPEIKPILKYVIPQIRNSIDHTDYYEDKRNNSIIFDDEKKLPLELSYDQFKNCIHWIVNEELIFSCAEDELKIPLYKTIVEDTKKVKKYCSILQIDFNCLLQFYLKRGKSIFELAWILEKIIFQNQR